jgi:hypothetical protein
MDTPKASMTSSLETFHGTQATQEVGPSVRVGQLRR